MKKRFFTLFLIAIAVYSESFCQVEYNSSDISQRWKYYSSEVDRLIPLDNVDNPENLSMDVDLVDGQQILLRPLDGSKIMVYLNSVPRVLVKDSILLSLGVVKQEYQTNKIRLTVYSDSQDLVNSIRSELQVPTSIKTVTKDSLNYQERVDKSYYLNFVFISAFLVFLLFIIITLNPSGEIVDLVSIYRSLTFSNRDEVLLKSKPFDKIGLPVLGFLALIVSMVYLLARFLNPSVLHDVTIFSDSTTAGLLGNLFVIAVAFTVFIVIKYVLESLLTTLFNFHEYLPIQYFNNLRMSLWIFGLGFLLLTGILLIFRGKEEMFSGVVIYGIIFLLIIRMIFLFIKLISSARYTIFHLFSYFCATEILPFLVLYKFFLK